MQLIEGLGYPVHWWEMPARYDLPADAPAGSLRKTPFGQSCYRPMALDFLEGQLQDVIGAVEGITGTELTEGMLRGSVDLFNGIRGRIRQLRDLVYGSRPPPLPGLEMYLAEFIAIHTCSEPEESIRVLDGLLELVHERVSRGTSPFDETDPVRVFWVTPPTDASLISILEDSGGCVAGTEYLISHAFLPLSTGIGTVRAVAENCMDDCMTGSPSFRARRIVAGARRYGAEGVLISGIFGASHCPWDEGAIARTVREELGIPVLSFDVPYSPGRPSEQVVNRIESFTEILRARRL
jgi:benzoyl-CoA reductase/2-hydroxyglutaryl-CoA dehydratase subunit BcrC/BadD/HgdB